MDPSRSWLRLAKFSLGVGDRFGQQAQAQLRACRMAAEHGVEVVPVWNKSNREHLIVGSEPASVRAAAAAAVRELGWEKPWHVDADHIRLDTVDRFLAHADFFTLDVADAVGKPPGAGAIEAFAGRHPELARRLDLPGAAAPLQATRADVKRIAREYLVAVQEAAAIYRRIAAANGEGRFITEVSIDETERPQTPLELLVILAALAEARVPLQTIAPKFTGRFNKGVDYVGDVAQFEREFSDDLAVLAFAVKTFGLPANLKLSVHSGSDKFALYPPIRRVLQRRDAGLHLKTAGTTWLEELLGLAKAGGKGLALAKEIYAEAVERRDELCAPYAAVIDIDRARLPKAGVVATWTSEQFASALRHDPANSVFNPHLRQLLHVAYKLAATRSERYLKSVADCRATIARNVTANLYGRHLKPLFVGLDECEESVPLSPTANSRRRPNDCRASDP